MTFRTKKVVLALVSVSLLAGGCASRPENVTASHVSSSRYMDRTCKSLAREYDEVAEALRVQSAKLNDKATQDAVVTGVGVILFWPVLFALGNNAGLEGDVARLKGEEQAIRRQMRDADCELPPPRTPPADGTTAAGAQPAGATPAVQAPPAAVPVSAPAGTTASAAPVAGTGAGGSPAAK